MSNIKDIVGVPIKIGQMVAYLQKGFGGFTPTEMRTGEVFEIFQSNARVELASISIRSFKTNKTVYRSNAEVFVVGLDR